VPLPSVAPRAQCTVASPVPAIRVVQSDNGSEFLGEFEVHLRNLQLKQVFSYPRCPKINGCVERYQRTLQEEFIEVYE